MNWRRGSFRIWVLFTAVWACLWTAALLSAEGPPSLTNVPSAFELYDPAKADPNDPFKNDRIVITASGKIPITKTDLVAMNKENRSIWWEEFWLKICVTLGFPVAILVFGAGVGWAFKGFTVRN